MSTRDSALIDLAEAVYDLAAGPDEWLRKVLDTGSPVLDHGLGVFALACFRPPVPGPIEIDRVYAFSGPDDFGARLDDLRTRLGTEILWPLSRPGLPKTLSEVTDEHDPTAFRAIMEHFPFAEDGLGIAGFDPDGHGIYIVSALPKVTTLSKGARERWQMVAAHFSAGYRLRRAIESTEPQTSTRDELPFGAEVIIDPASFRVTEARGQAKSRPALSALRDAAKHVDRARGELRKTDPGKALQMWSALVRGRWSTVDWFDSGGRRYVLGIPNPPGITDPRGLTEREMQVLSYTFFGLTSKMVAYHLGLSKGRISALLSSAMRKLGVETRSQLVRKLHDFRSITGP